VSSLDLFTFDDLRKIESLFCAVRTSSLQSNTIWYSIQPEPIYVFALGRVFEINSAWFLKTSNNEANMPILLVKLNLIPDRKEDWHRGFRVERSRNSKIRNFDMGN